jgi:sugar lactone lactonase YvrE
MLQLSTKQYNTTIRPGFYWRRSTWLLLLLFSSVLIGLREQPALAAPRAVEAPPAYRTQWGSQGGSSGQFSGPIGMAIDSSGNLYVVDTNNRRIQKFTLNGSFVSAITPSPQMNAPFGAAVDASGTLYVADTNNHRILKFNSNGNALGQIGSGFTGSGNGQFNTPFGVAVDSSGNLYVADTLNHRIQKFNSSGSYLSQFGSMGNGTGQFNRPSAVAVDSTGNIYVADGLNDRIQKFNSSGVYLTHWVGTGSGDGQLRTPLALALDSSSNLYVADTFNHRIQKFTNTGVYLSQWGSNGNGDGQFFGPRGVALDSSGNIYVADSGNHRVQLFTYGSVAPEIELLGNNFPIANGDNTPDSSDYTDFGSVPTSSGAIVRTFFIGNSGVGPLNVTLPTVTGDAAADFVISRAPAGSVGINRTTSFDVTFDPTAVGLRTATMTIANNDSDENPYTFVIQGTGTNQHRVNTSTNGDGIGVISLNPPGGLYDFGTVVTATVNLASWSVLSSWSGDCSGAGLCVLTMDSAKRITATITYAEPSNSEAPPPYRMQWGLQGSGSGQFQTPRGIATDSSGHVYIADTNNHRLQKFAGSSVYLAGWGAQGSGNGQFNFPGGMATDSSGNLYVADTNNHRIQKFDSNGAFLTTLGSYGVNNGQFCAPADVAIDGSGNLYVVENCNHRIQKFDSSGAFLAKWGANGSGVGQLSYPRGLAVDSSGNVYVADSNNHRIQKFDSNGLFLTQWGTKGRRAGQFDAPNDVATDSSGNLYVADLLNHRIQKFTSSGAFLTQWGSAGQGLGQFNTPNAVAVDQSGNVFVVDTNNHRIQHFGTSAPVPEIELRGNGVVIVNGDTTPSSSDHTDFGYIQIGGTQLRTFAIHNIGSADLTNLAVTISGHAAFSLSTPPALTVSSGYTGAVGITFSAAAIGPVTATVTIASNDSDEAAYTFVVRGFTKEVPPTQLLSWNLQTNVQSSWPQAVATDSSGNLYVADHNNHEIQKFDGNGLFLTRWGSLGSAAGQFRNPSGVAVDSNGNVYVTDKSTTPIQKFDSNGLFLIRWGSAASGPDQVSNVNGIAIDQSDNVYVVSSGTHRIQKFDSNGLYLTGWGSFGNAPGQFNGPFSIAIDRGDNVYIFESNTSRIQKFDTNGAYLGGWGTAGTLPGQFTRAYNIATDPAGNLYVADYGNGRIQKFAPNGLYLTEWAAATALGLVVDHNNNLYATNGTSPHVKKFGPAPAEIDVRGNGIAIASGDTTPASADRTDFGAVNSAGSTVVRTFAIHNTGSVALTGIAATLSGDAAFSLSTPPAATVSAAGYTTFTITYAPSVRGVMTAVVSLANSDSNENPYTFVIQGARVNNAPVAVNGALTTNEDTAQSVTLSASDGDGDALSYTIVGNPTNGTVTVVGNTATYTPTANFNGSDSFTFKANDGVADSNVATVAVTVNSVNDAPQTRLLTRPLNPSTGNVSFTFDGSDPDGTVAGFQCKLDSAAYAPCSSPQAYSGLSVGSHTFLVRAVDNNGAVDGSPARYVWNVAAGSATITIELAMTPQIINNVRFTGTLGTFYLDDGATDDGDAYAKSQLFPVAAGSYTINTRLFTGWLLTDLSCTPTAGAVIDRANQRVTLTVNDGDAVTCRFTNQRAARINARAYEDRVRNGLNLGRKNNADPLLPGVTMSLYLSPTNSLVGSTPTLGYSATITEARFSELPAGAYVLCAGWPGGWTATDPNPALPLAGYAGQACKAVTVQPGQVATLSFGAYPPALVSSALAGAENEPFESDQIIDLPLEAWPDDAQPEESDISEEGEEDNGEETTPAAQRSFLPLVLK